MTQLHLVEPENEPEAAPEGGLAERTLWVAGVAVAVASAAPAAGLWRFPQGVIEPWILALLVAAAILAGPRLGALQARFERPLPRWRGPLRAAVVALGLGLGWAMLYALRPKVGYGDAGAIVGFVQQGVIFHKREPLSPAFYLAVHRTLGAALRLDARGSIQLASALAGTFGLWAVARLATQLAGGRRLLAAAGFLAVCSAGAVQLFCGYIENYTIPAVCGLWCLDFGVRALEERRSMLPAAAVLTLGMGFHFCLLTLVPALGWLAWRRHYEGDARRILGPRTLSLLAVTVLPMAVLFVVMHHVGYLRADEKGFGGGDGLMFVPLTKLEGMSQYLFLRPAHLAAILNQQLLVGPLALLTALVLGTRPFLAGAREFVRERTVEGAGVLLFLALAGFGYFGLTVVWNPDLGALRDWDLFGPVGFFLSVLAVALAVRTYDREGRRAFALLVVVIAVNLSRTLPFVLHNLGA
jgi:hypothetical protein